MAGIIEGGGDDRHPENVNTDGQPNWERTTPSTGLSSLALGVLAVALFAAGIVLVIVSFAYAWEWLPRVALSLLGAWTLASSIALVASTSDELGPGHRMRHAAL